MRMSMDDLGRGLFDVGQVVEFKFLFKHKC
jgi:hypothetical protein